MFISWIRGLEWFCMSLAFAHQQGLTGHAIACKRDRQALHHEDRFP
jgi:hypothetical protein